MRDAAGAPDDRPAAVLPARPMTAGETLDAAAALLRRRAVPLLALAAPLAAGEQILLASLRERAGMAAPGFLPDLADLSGWWVATSAGFGAEAVIIALLGAYAGAAAGPALLGRPVRHRDLWRRTRPAPVLVVVAVIGVLAGPAAFLGFAPWLAVYGLLGMATAVLTLDRVPGPFAALGRSARLAVRDGMRALLVRLLGYLAWFLVRFALGTGWFAVADQVGLVTGGGWLVWVVPVAWGFANTIAYAALACLDAVVLVETRIRTEGLDISLSRARARGEDEAAVL